MKLYTYFRSSAAYRVRIALNLKKLPYEAIPIHLTKDGGRHKSAEYRAINPQMRVPALTLDGGETILQSLAIVEYLEETHPNPPLLPKGALERAHVRAVSQIVACDIHPLNNLVTLNYLKKLGHDQAIVDEWYASWVKVGLRGDRAAAQPGPYCFGAEPGMADLCLVPQVFNARRFKVSLEAYPEDRGRRGGLRQARRFRQGAPGKPARQGIATSFRRLQAVDRAKRAPGANAKYRPRHSVDDRHVAVILGDGDLDPLARGPAVDIRNPDTAYLRRAGDPELRC